jgi:hypothetical protein
LPGAFLCLALWAKRFLNHFCLGGRSRLRDNRIRKSQRNR